MSGPKDTSRYYNTYRVDHHPEGLTVEEVEKDPELGGAHDVLLLSMMHQSDGGLSVLAIDRTHDDKGLEPLEVFRVLTLAMVSVVDELPEDSWQRAVVARFVADVRDQVLSRNKDTLIE